MGGDRWWCQKPKLPWNTCNIFLGKIFLKCDENFLYPTFDSHFWSVPFLNRSWVPDGAKTKNQSCPELLFFGICQRFLMEKYSAWQNLHKSANTIGVQKPKLRRVTWNTFLYQNIWYLFQLWLLLIPHTHTSIRMLYRLDNSCSTLSGRTTKKESRFECVPGNLNMTEI